MDLFLNRLFDGLSNGATYALIALALVMIFKATTLINFAQGEFAMIGAFIVLVLASEQGVPMWIAVILAMVLFWSTLAPSGTSSAQARAMDAFVSV